MGRGPEGQEVAAAAREITVQARGETVPVTLFEPARPASDLLFLHGYARHPLDYRALLERFVREGHRVVAPFVFANGSLERTPTTFWACAALARRVVEALVRGGHLAPGSAAFGHSTGGAVTLTLGGSALDPAALVAVNPVQPSSASSPLFIARSAWMNTKMAFGLAGDGRAARRVLSDSGRRFYGNWLRSAGRNYRLIGGLKAYDHVKLARWTSRRGAFRGPATVLYGHGDEFYPSCQGLEAGLSAVFEDFELEELPGENSHEWLMFRLDLAHERIGRALHRG
ncbi:MAG: hypothetical protein VX460_11275 [Planctomycetota bacterium]|nr:hypothetical protein [Planctomycetota bacterium]